MSKPENPFANLDLGAVFGRMAPPAVDFGALSEAQRRNIEAVAEANRLAIEGLQTVTRRQTEIAQEVFAFAQRTLSDLASISAPADRAAQQTEAFKAALERAVTHSRELADLAGRANSEAFDVLHKRLLASLDEVKAQMKP